MKKLGVLFTVCALILSLMIGCKTETSVTQEPKMKQQTETLQSSLPEKEKQNETKPEPKPASSAPQKAEKQEIIKKEEQLKPKEQVPINNSVQKKEKAPASKPASPQLTIPKKSEKTELPQPNQEKNVVTVSIKGPDDIGTILSPTQIEWKQGDTPFTVLKRITREKKIHMEFSGSGKRIYVEGIHNLYEFDRGAGSGWMYSVNGIFGSKSAGATELKPGDTIEWSYTLNLGKDLGAERK